MLRQCKCINIILLLFINLFHTQITLSQWRVWFAFNFGLSILIMILLYFQHVIKFISLFKQCFTDYRKGVFFKRLPRLLETPWFSLFFALETLSFSFIILKSSLISFYLLERHNLFRGTLLLFNILESIIFV